MIYQHTLKTSIRTTGIGLHSGNKVTLNLRPAPANTGIVFRRVDLADATDFRVDPHLVSDTRMCSALQSGNSKVSTVEHLMSALAGLGVDNLFIDIDAAEVPIMDGSAAPFVFLIQSAGLARQNAPRRFVEVLQTVRVEDGDKWAEFSPYPGYRLDFSIAFDHPILKRSGSEASFDFSMQSYGAEISRARTFGFTSDVEYLRSHGLALGGNLDNAVVMDNFHVLNSEGLRYADEFVKHKVLDAIGDLYLIGHPILGHFKAHKSGHALNNTLLCALMDNAHAWRWASYAQAAEAPETIQSWSRQIALAQ